ncbi:META domain-containing protein [Novosphingobium resinovorum]|nr:META domain-containing protein [Novosphingobium resinovorum]
MRRLALLLCPLLLAGCSDAGHLTQRGPAGENWVGSQWHFAAIDGRAPEDASAQVAFEGEHLLVQVGCNRLKGPWRMEAERLIAGPFDQTEAVCPSSSWEQGNAVSALLAATPRVTVEGKRMILQSSGHTAELTRAVD